MLTRPTIKKRGLVVEGEIADDYLEVLLTLTYGLLTHPDRRQSCVVSITCSDDLNKLVGRGRVPDACRNSPGWRCIRRSVCDY